MPSGMVTLLWVAFKTSEPSPSIILHPEFCFCFCWLEVKADTPDKDTLSPYNKTLYLDVFSPLKTIFFSGKGSKISACSYY